MMIMVTDHIHVVPEIPLHADVGIVGSGPAGLFAAYYAGLRELSVAVADSLDTPGGQLAALYPDKAIYDVAGHPAISGQELVDALLEQLRPMPVQFLGGHTVTSLEPLSGDAPGAGAPRWRLGTRVGAALHCAAVVLSS